MSDFMKRHYNDVQRIAFVRLLTPCITVYGFQIPAEWMQREYGVNVRVFSEVSAFKPDGSLARAGEAFHTVVMFHSPEGIAEKRVFAGWRTVWTQDVVDYEVFAVVERQRQLLVAKRIDEERRRQAAEADAERKRVRQQMAGYYFQQHGQRVDSFKIGQKVATLDDGKVWQIVKKHALQVELGWLAAVRFVPLDTVVIKGSKEGLKMFREAVK